MTDTTHTGAQTPAHDRDTLITAFARLWAEGLSEQNERTPEQAARAAGAQTDAEVAAWIAAHRPAPAAEMPQAA